MVHKENGNFSHLCVKCKSTRMCCVVAIGTVQRGPNPAKEQWLLLLRKENAWHHLETYHHDPAPRRPSAGAVSSSWSHCPVTASMQTWGLRHRNGSVLKEKCRLFFSLLVAKSAAGSLPSRSLWRQISIYPAAWQHLGIVATDCCISDSGSVYSVTWVSRCHNGINNPRNNTANYYMP